MLPELTQHELAAAVDHVAAGLLERTGIAAPPVDAFRVAASCGLSVLTDEEQGGRARFVRLQRQLPGCTAGSIFVRSDSRPERMQWAVAHEIGESQAARVFRQLGVAACEAMAGARERVANALASHLLLPTAWFLADARQCRWDLADLKRRYATASHELIARRMLDFEPPVIVTVFDQGRVTWRHASLGGRPPRLVPEERICWRQAHETGEPQSCRGRGLDIHAWAVHEPGWRREIMRTELPDSACDLDVSEDGCGAEERWVAEEGLSDDGAKSAR